eukprot:Ihof_evm2s493 gene=Ihof_evmTU2s493
MYQAYGHPGVPKGGPSQPTPTIYNVPSSGPPPSSQTPPISGQSRPSVPSYQGPAPMTGGPLPTGGISIQGGTQNGTIMQGQGDKVQVGVPDFLKYDMTMTFDRVKDEFSVMHKRIGGLQQDLARLGSERAENEINYQKYHEMAARINQDLQAQAEVYKRFSGIYQKILSLLPPDLHSQFQQNLEQAKAINPAEMEDAIQRRLAIMSRGSLAPHSPRSHARSNSGASPRLMGLPVSNLPYVSPLVDEKRIKPSQPDEDDLPIKPSEGDVNPVEEGDKNQAKDERRAQSVPRSPIPPTNDKLNMPRTESKSLLGHNGPPSGLPRPPLPPGYNSQYLPGGALPPTPPPPPGASLKPVQVQGPAVPFMSAPPMGEAALNWSRDLDGPYAFTRTGNGLVPVQFPYEPAGRANVPKGAEKIAQLDHGEVVCAVAISNNNQFMFTGGKGCVKMWDIQRPHQPVMELPCLNDNYIRSCKLMNDDRTLVVGGETTGLFVWDIGPTPRVLSVLESKAPACYALSVGANSNQYTRNQVFSCCSDGDIMQWDIYNQKCVRLVHGHTDGASCIDMTQDGSYVFTGGLDNVVRTWDVRNMNPRSDWTFSFGSQIFSLGVCPTEPVITVGLENSHVEMLNYQQPNNNTSLRLHNNCVLSLKFAHRGNWFMTTGKDNYLSIWKTLHGVSLYK